MAEPVSVRDHHAFMQAHMPDLGHQVEDFRVYTWRVTKWSLLDRQRRSLEFTCGGYKWTILLYPLGNTNTSTTPAKSNAAAAGPASSTFVSIYLEHSKSNLSDGEGWHVCVQFGLAMSNVNDPTTHSFNHAYHRYVTEEPDWGFTRFSTLQNLVSVQEGKTRSIIEKDMVDVIVYMRVLKDETGVLWHNFINYDSKKHTGYVGIKNLGATGYLSACLQILFCLAAFRKLVYKIPGEDGSVTSALQSIFYDMQTSISAVSPAKLTKAFGWTSLDHFLQHDVQEFWRVIMNKLTQQAKGTSLDGNIQSTYTGKMKSYIQALNVDFEVSHMEEFEDIQVEVKGMRNLAVSFRDYISLEILDGQNKHDTGTPHGLQAARKGISIMSFPPVLSIQLRRYMYDVQQDRMVKYAGRHEYPAEIDLVEFLDDSADKSQSWVYTLYGVIVHSGDSSGGQYYSFVKPTRNARWLKFSDDRVTPALDRDVFEDNYGRDGDRGRFKSAYVLVYVRKIMIDELLGPVTESDIPSELKTQLEQERAMELERKRQEEEAARTIVVKVVDDESFKQYQGFDLALYSSPQIASFRVPKDHSFQTLRSTVADHFKYDQTQFRLWVQIHRQNKTVRPDTPILDTNPSITVDTIRGRMGIKPPPPQLLLYLDVIKEPKELADSKIIIFLKYFDASKQSLLGFGSRHVPKTTKVGDLQQSIISEMKWPASTQLKFYEEVKPDMIELMSPKLTLAASEVQNGDIICFQIALSEDENNHLEEYGLCPTPISFYQQLQNVTNTVSQATA